MSEPLRAPEPDETDPHAGSGDATFAHEASDDVTLAELAQRAREQAEALAAVGAVMEREESKAAAIAAKAKLKRREAPLKLILLTSLIALNFYAWIGNPPWLQPHVPPMPDVDYYAASWKLAVYLQRQRIEEYRITKGHLPAVAAQAGPPVKGVQYVPLQTKDYELSAGDGAKRFVYHSTDSLSVFVGRAFIQMSLIAGGAR